jgi:hypothetical protein
VVPGELKNGEVRMRTEDQINLSLNSLRDFWLANPQMTLLQVLEAARREVDPNMRLDTMTDSEVFCALNRLRKRKANPGSYFASF